MMTNQNKLQFETAEDFLENCYVNFIENKVFVSGQEMTIKEAKERLLWFD